MKHRTWLLLLALILGSGAINSQDDLVLTNCPDDFNPDPDREIHRLVEHMPSWKGCETIDFPAKRDDCTAEKVGEFIAENLVYPERAQEMELEGEVWIKFVVETNGCLSNIAISRTLGGHTGWEAQKLVRSMPWWVPGKHKGAFASVEVHIPIEFKLQ